MWTTFSWARPLNLKEFTFSRLPGSLEKATAPLRAVRSLLMRKALLFLTSSQTKAEDILFFAALK